jgi:hypothetical protein
MRSNLIFTAFGFVILLAFTSSAQDLSWEAAGRWHRPLKKAVPGTFLLDQEGVEFRSPKLNRRWPYVDIRSFDVSLRDVTLFTYESRPWHEPGERPFHFTLTEVLPPRVVALVTERVGKPVRNGSPIPSSSAVAQIPAHHRMWIGGSSGMLRLKDDGIDYVTENGRDSRSWRWADIQTLGNPTAYEFRVTAYREIVEFDLKQPMPRDLFERMWDRLYAPGLNLAVGDEAGHVEVLR